MNIVGKPAEIRKLSTVRVNPWNTNDMSKFERDSLKHGLKTDGWMASQALLIWGKDDKGKEQNLIIDGENRYLMAKELGFKDAPMVVVDGWTRDKAREVTIKLNAKRSGGGRFREDDLAKQLQELQGSFEAADISLDLGIAPDHMAKLFASLPTLDTRNVPDKIGKLPEDMGGAGAQGAATPSAGSGAPDARMVQLFLDTKKVDRFNKYAAALADHYGTETISDTVMRAMKAAYKAARTTETAEHVEE